MLTTEEVQTANHQNETEDTPLGSETPEVKNAFSESEKYKLTEEDIEETWEHDARNPYNWPTKLKVLQVLTMASAAFTT
jgi:hypothetical protein